MFDLIGFALIIGCCGGMLSIVDAIDAQVAILSKLQIPCVSGLELLSPASDAFAKAQRLADGGQTFTVPA